MMTKQDHPIYKHVQHDARARAERAAGGFATPTPETQDLVEPPISSAPVAPAGHAAAHTPASDAPAHPPIDPHAIVSPPALAPHANGSPGNSYATAPASSHGLDPDLDDDPAPTAHAGLLVPAPGAVPPTGLIDDGDARPGAVRRFLGAILPPYGKPAARGSNALPALRQREKLVHALADKPMRRHTRYRLVSRSSEPTPGRLVDTLLAGPGEPKLPDETFPRLRWGGVFAFVGNNEKSVRNLAESYDNKRGFVVEHPTTPLHAGPPIPGLRTHGYYFIARKTQLLQPGDTTERFTYHVELAPCAVGPDTPDGYMVVKRVPSLENMIWRLRVKFPQVDIGDLEQRAQKLVNHVFPTFLTREAAMLGILQKNLAPEYRHKVPRPLGIEKDSRGFVRTLHMNWMRVGGPTLSQLDFAEQSAELLTALHEQARVMHLDLRMDNMVITEAGVGFVDFGSACRIGEEIGESPMLDTLFSEMMRTSQIQRMLGKMLERGHVTNQAMADVHGKVDKTVDSFYLAVQITKPHGNPEIKQLIDFDPDTPTAQALSSLTAAVLRPKNPAMAQYKTARDILRGIHRIRRRVEEDRAKRAHRKGKAA